MASLFADAAVLASQAVDAVLGETLRITPMVPGRYKDAVSDPDRASFDVVGAFHDGPDRMKLSSSTVGRDFDHRFVLAKTYATIGNDLLVGRVIKKGDRVSRADEPGTPEFEISTIESDGVQRTMLTLVAVNAE